MTQQELEAFIAKGGKITKVPTVVREPSKPRRPRSSKWSKANAFKSGGWLS